jgi:hypothetical protein
MKVSGALRFPYEFSLSISLSLRIKAWWQAPLLCYCALSLHTLSRSPTEKRRFHVADVMEQGLTELAGNISSALSFFFFFFSLFFFFLKKIN